MAWSEGAEGPAQHLAAAIAAAFARAEQPGEHLAVHAPKLAVKPRLQILRRHRRSLLLRLEHPHRPAVEDHVNRASRLGLHRSIILRIGNTQRRESFVRNSGIRPPSRGSDTGNTCSILSGARCSVRTRSPWKFLTSRKRPAVRKRSFSATACLG